MLALDALGHGGQAQFGGQAHDGLHHVACARGVVAKETAVELEGAHIELFQQSEGRVARAEVVERAGEPCRTYVAYGTLHVFDGLVIEEDRLGHLHLEQAVGYAEAIGCSNEACKEAGVLEMPA
ncbi:hypothetical protein K270103H11_13820 [Gordonibacter urolithinfaciens]